MTVKELVLALGLKVFNMGEDVPVNGGYTSDLLSDVMGHADAGRVWITLQTHKNTVAIASLKELAAIVLVKGLEPDPDTLKMAKAEGITILGTGDGEFEVSGKVYALLNK